MNDMDDFMAVVEADKTMISTVVLSRNTGLTYLREKGINITISSFDKLKRPATDLYSSMSAIWVIVIDEKICSIAKLINPINFSASS